MQTSALDTYTEQTLLQNINSILREKKRTSVFVAHRLRTIFDSGGSYPLYPRRCMLTVAAHTDQIIVLSQGHVAEQGTHTKLLEKAGLYSELWSGECLWSIHRQPKRLLTNMMDASARDGIHRRPRLCRRRPKRDGSEDGSD